MALYNICCYSNIFSLKLHIVHYLIFVCKFIFIWLEDKQGIQKLALHTYLLMICETMKQIQQKQILIKGQQISNNSFYLFQFITPCPISLIMTNNMCCENQRRNSINKYIPDMPVYKTVVGSYIQFLSDVLSYFESKK